MTDAYSRYEIQIETTPDIVKVPSRFRVKTRRHKLLGLIFKELFEHKGNMPVILSRPCMYGVFGRPVGGMAPIHDKCVGCLRCTVQYPDVVQIVRNPARQSMGDSYLTPDNVDTILYEAHAGHTPVRGAGYRGEFGGPGWDGMWLDMSEIVRPTRDGIHGREFVSTEVDLGARPMFLTFDEEGKPTGDVPRMWGAMVPFVFEPAPNRTANRIFGEAARQMHTYATVPVREARENMAGGHVIPLLADGDDAALLDSLPEEPRFVAIEGSDPERIAAVNAAKPEALVIARIPADADPVPVAESGVAVIHLLADFHGEVDGRFMLDLIREAHGRLVEAGIRERVTLIGSGGMVMAEHMPKAIVCGLDAVGIDTAAWIALQASFEGEVRDRANPPVKFPSELGTEWGIKRMRNLVSTWRDQLLEILGAMGMREVRRLRGEVGRCMFQDELEEEAFGDLEGYVAR